MLYFDTCSAGKVNQGREHQRSLYLARFWLASMAKKENLLASRTLRKRGKISPSEIFLTKVARLAQG